MKKNLLKYLICPSCKSGFKIKSSQEKNGEIISGNLICANWHRFQISLGIPRLLDKKRITALQKKTQDTFSIKWQKIPAFGFEDKTRNFHLKWYLQRYGWKKLKNLTNFLSTRKFILDAGTGLGRDTKLYAENTQGQVFGLDISKSIDIAYQHIGHLPNVHLIQADLTRLPFRTNFFDFISSDQVLHHTPDTKKSFFYLAGFLSKGGQIAFYVYKKKGPIREFCDDYLRKYTTELSPVKCYEFSKTITKFGKSLSDLKMNIRVPEDIPFIEIKAGKHNLQRFIYWNILKCFWNDDFDFETNIMINFDWYHPKYAHRHTEEEVKNWIHKKRLKTLNFNVIESGISARAIKCAE